MSNREMEESPDHSQEDGYGEDLAAEPTQSKAPPRKRRRVVISCTECHRRKQKCDRKLPCTNCVSRNKEAACRYETGKPLEQGQKKDARSNQDAPAGTFERMPVKAVDFGYSTNGTSTLGFLRKIEGTGEPLADVAVSAEDSELSGARERYKSLIRQLPARPFIDKLAQIYVHDFNWQYFSVDEWMFYELLDQWYNLPFNVLSSAGPQGMKPELRAFPALLFQVLATALLSLPIADDSFDFEPLKYMSSMSFEDLALEYSESSVALLSILGKRHMTLTTVQTGFVRAAFLKYTGMVTEAWHQVGTAIRDAQEIGLHRDEYDPKPGPNDSAEEALEKTWTAQSRRRLWMTLCGWDLHTGAILGRPTSLDLKTFKRSAPIDSPLPKNKHKTPVYQRGPNDPPTPLTRSIWAYEVMRRLRDILDLEKEGPVPKDFSKVDRIHRELLELQDNTPSYFRLKNPDTRFDHLEECWWLPLVRPTLPQLLSFNFMALHRPYIFTRPASRLEALRGSLDMLECQRMHFAALDPQHWKTFSLFFGTFDAIVMMASIYILFPKEHPEMLADALQHFQWAVERFETMATRNRLANAALGVLNAIYIRLKKAVGHGFVTKPSPLSMSTSTDRLKVSSASSAKSSGGSGIPTPASSEMSSSAHHPSVSSVNSADQGYPSASTAGTDMAMPANEDLMGMVDWSLPSGFDFSAMAPMYPMGDVAYNDLTGVRENGYSSAGWVHSSLDMLDNLHMQPDPQSDPQSSGAVPWQFGGEFGNDTIWNLLNQFQPN